MNKSIDELRAERDQWRAEAAAILERCGDNDLMGDDAARFDTLVADIKARDEHLNRLDRARDLDLAAIRAAATGNGGRFAVVDADRGGRDHDEDAPGGGQRRDAAMRTLERSVADGLLPAHGAERVESLLTTGTDLARSWTARWAAQAGSDAYLSAFSKIAVDPARGHLRWTAEEAQAFRAVEALRDEQRAMSLTDTAGGFLAPVHLDPSVILSSDGSVSPLRQIARTVTINTDVWHGVTSEGAVASYDAEAEEVSDDSPTLAQPAIPVHKLQVFVPFSIEIQGDAAGFVQEVQKIVVDAAEQEFTKKYTIGSGTGEPTGIITALAGGSSIVAPTTAESFSAADVYKVLAAVPPRYRQNAQWCANLSVILAMAQMETAGGALKFPGLQSNPMTLLNRAIHEASWMDGTIDSAATADNLVLLCGDFKKFVLVERVGTTIELVPHLFGNNKRPTGQRGMYLWARNGSDVVVDNAFRLLNVATTA